MRSPITAISNTTRSIIDDAIVIGEVRDRTVDRLEHALSRRELAEKLYDHDLHRRQREWKDGTRDVSCEQLAIEAPSWHVAIGLPRGIVTPTGQSKLTVHAAWNELLRFLIDRRVESKAVDRANELAVESAETTDGIVTENGMDGNDNATVILSKVRQLEMFGG